jgi:predicted TIM-barrel fold metal-dependent hydrolase
MTTQGLSRRGLLAMAAAAAAGRAVAQPTPARGAIDVHHHLLPPAYLAMNRDALLATVKGFEGVLAWTPQRSLDALDAAGAQGAVLSLSAPVWTGDVARGRELVRISNDYGAELAARYPRRFGFYAILPVPDVEGSLAEIARAFDTLRCDGAIVVSNYGGRHLGEPTFAPVLAELNRRRAVVYVHPVANPCCLAQVPDLSPAVLEFPTDTTRTIADLMLSGRLAACPDIRFIFSHGGGSLPMLADRLRTWVRVRPELAAKVPAGFDTEAGRLFFDTASVTNPPAFAALSAFARPTNVLFGTDFPFAPVKPQLDALRALATPAQYAAIGRDNALRLFPRFA